MSNIKSITGDAIPPPDEPVASLVEMLEGLLKDAKSGHLRQFAFAAVTNTEQSYTGLDCSNNKFQLLGALVYCQDRLIGAIDR